mgnify:CR=1 FL=1
MPRKYRDAAGKLIRNAAGLLRQCCCCFDLVPADWPATITATFTTVIDTTTCRVTGSTSMRPTGSLVGSFVLSKVSVTTTQAIYQVTGLTAFGGDYYTNTTCSAGLTTQTGRVRIEFTGGFINCAYRIQAGTSSHSYFFVPGELYSGVPTSRTYTQANQTGVFTTSLGDVTFTI